MTRDTLSSSNTVQNGIEKAASLSHIAIARVAEFVSKAMEDPSKMKTIVQNGFSDLFKKNPQFEIKAVNAFYQNFKNQLTSTPVLERLPKIKAVTKMFEDLFGETAKNTLNINADNALNTANIGFKNKQASLHQTYHKVQDSLYTEVSGHSLPTA